jgi:putative restriction endonuclease
LPGYGFIAWELDRFEQGKQEVYQYNWDEVENPFTFAIQGSVQNQLIDQLLQNINVANEIYQRVRIRGVSQLIFRQTLLRVYQSSCAFCGLTLDVALEASHIIPWSECEDRDKLNVQNGLLLCSVHHRLFDAGALIVTDDYIINRNVISQDFFPTTDFDRLLYSDFDGKPLRLPVNEQHRPGLRFLAVHRQQSTENE